MRGKTIKVTGFTSDAFIVGRAYRIRIDSEYDLMDALDYDFYDDIEHGGFADQGLTKSKLIDVMEKGVDAIFVGFNENRTIAYFDTYAFEAVRHKNCRAASPDSLKITADRYANGDSINDTFSIYIDELEVRR